MYFSKWKELLHIKETLTTTSEARKSLSITLRDPSRSLAAPPIPQQQLQPHVVTAGFLQLDPAAIVAQPNARVAEGAELSRMTLPRQVSVGQNEMYYI